MKTICSICYKEHILTNEEKEKYCPNDPDDSVRYIECKECRYKRLCLDLPLIYRDAVDKYKVMEKLDINKSYFFYGIMLIAVLIFMCYKTINKGEFEMLTLYKYLTD